MKLALAFRLARRDLKGGLGGLGLLWLCLAVALAGLASVTSLASSIDGAIAAQGRTLVGGDLLLSVAQRQPSAAEVSAIQELGPSARSVGMRAMLVAPDGESMLAELTGADAAWPLAGKLVLAPGGWRPNAEEVAIGRAAAERLALRQGDRLRIGRADFTISAIIESMPREAGFALSPPALVDSAGLARTGLVQPGSLTTTSFRLLLPAASDPEAVGLAFQQRFPDGGWRSTDRNEGGSGTRRFVDRLGQMLLLVALSALAIGGLGMSSAAAAFAASRRPSIAILKLVGARRSTINAMLLIELGIVAGLAILAGLAVGAVTPALVSSIAAPLLPVAPDPSPQWAALALAALFGVLVTFASSWTAIASASETRPAQLLRGDVGGSARLPARQLAGPILALTAAAALAIATATNPGFAAIGIGVIAALCGLFALLGLAIRRIVRGLKHRGGPTTRLGIAALDRPGAGTGRLAVSLGMGLTLLVVLAVTASSILAEIDSSVPKRAPALFLVDIPREEADRFTAVADAELPGAEIRLVPSLRGPVTAINGTRVTDMKTIPEGAWILRGSRGLTFAAELPEANRVVAGEWWPANYRGPPLVSIDVEAATALGLKVGDTMTIGVLGRPVEATIASFRAIDWRSLGFNFAIIFAPGTLEAAPYTLMATVAPAPGVSVAAFERRLTSELPMVSAVRVAEVVEQAKILLGSIDGAVRIATGFAILMGMIVLAGSVVATRRERRRDIVLLRLVGATRGEVAKSQLVEFAFLSVAVAIAALILGAVAAWALVVWLFEFNFSPDWLVIAAIPAGAILLAVLAAFVAALPALNARPAEGLRAL
ncbi:MAG: FtsX-like permease family protein [Pseudomonadota bacterium]|nr:FtsX-like permease family protein [Pseudomonadota bacterium]